MLGLILAISLLVIVLSVMNGFDKEMRERILSLVPHVTVYSQSPITQWQSVAQDIAKHPDVSAVTPFAHFDTLLQFRGEIETARGIGLDVNDKQAVGQLLASLDSAVVDAFARDPQGLILGVGIAQHLGVSVGDSLSLIVPSEKSAGRSSAAKFQVVRLSAILVTGTELDQAIALVHLPLASEMAGLGGGVSGFRITTNRLFDVQRIAWDLVTDLPHGYYSTHWMMTHGNLYSAIQLSRDLVSILLFSIIAVAAFNVVSSLVLVVIDKRGNIAILRTLGASGADIGWIFLLQGALIGVVGVTLGTLLGALGSLAVPGLVAQLERLLDVQFLNTDVYPVSFLPVDLLLSDVLMIAGVALVMCAIAAIYPARRAMLLAPAQVLNQER